MSKYKAAKGASMAILTLLLMSSASNAINLKQQFISGLDVEQLEAIAVDAEGIPDASALSSGADNNGEQPRSDQLIDTEADTENDLCEYMDLGDPFAEYDTNRLSYDPKTDTNLHKACISKKKGPNKPDEQTLLKLQ